jgi:hypothetical protein
MKRIGLAVLGALTFSGFGGSGGDIAADAARDGALAARGRHIFRFDTFGDEAKWTDSLRMHEVIEAAVDPATALAVGLKVDADALPQAVKDGIADGSIDLASPATTLALLKLDAVVGLKGTVETVQNVERLTRVGVTCALCHSTVDDSFAPGIGKRLDGWPNRDLNVGAIISLAPDLQPVADTLGTDVGTVKKVLAAWGPGKFDAELFLDGKGFRPDGKSSAVLIPPAYGLAGVNQHTYTGWGSIPYWNAFVANLEMHGQGTFTDSRLDDAAKFPVAAKNHLGHVTAKHDLISSKLPALQFYQLALRAPKPPPGSFDHKAAARGKKIFMGQGTCSSCHVAPTFSDPGFNMHKPAEICTDSFQADRSPDGMYRTTPLRGLWSHTKGGFYHDGRYATLGAVVDHYNQCMNLGLSAGQKSDLVQYLKSL